MTKKKILTYFENFSSYIRSFSENGHDSVMEKLIQIWFKKPEEKPKFTARLLERYLMLRYTSLPAYRLLLNHFPLPSVSLLKKLSHGVEEPLKAIEWLLCEKKIDKDVILLVDEMYLQREEQFQVGKLVGCNMVNYSKAL